MVKGRGSGGNAGGVRKGGRGRGGRGGPRRGRGQGRGRGEDRRPPSTDKLDDALTSYFAGDEELKAHHESLQQELRKQKAQKEQSKLDKELEGYFGNADDEDEEAEAEAKVEA